MVKLTSMVSSSGCAAKFPAKTLKEILSFLPKAESPSLKEGFSEFEDALIYRVQGDLMCLATVDFFPPMVDDPFVFGQIAASNALSDIYAMGAYPGFAMNLLCMPSCLDKEVMKQILLGGASKVREAGAVVAGGHTIADPVPKYGLCAVGFEKEDRIWRNSGAKAGDDLVLTKALGVGITSTAAKAGKCPDEVFRQAVSSMIMLNKQACSQARALEIHGATDVTGFGLLGHAMEMAFASGVCIELEFGKIPIIDGVLELAEKDLVPGGLFNNVEYVGKKAEFAKSLSKEQRLLLYDPQTSGGLLLAMPPEDAKILVKKLSGTRACVIGKVSEGPSGIVRIRC